MFYLPTLPPWDGLHPLVIHFPIALVFVSPLLILLAMLWKQQTRTLLIVATLMMALAAAGAWLATSTGGAAEEFAKNVPGARSILHEHEELGEAARNFTTVLAVVLLAAASAFCKWSARVPRAAVVAGGILFLIANGATALVISNAAHEGGRLVHEVGVRARLAGVSSATGGGGATVRNKAARDDD